MECTVSWGIDLPLEHSVSTVNNKIIISCGSSESEAAKNLLVPLHGFLHFNCSSSIAFLTKLTLMYTLLRIVLDVSSIKGGAPGRTRGLDVYEVHPCSKGLEVINKLS